MVVSNPRQLSKTCGTSQRSVAELAGGYPVLKENHVACHVERLPAAGAAQSDDFAVRDQAFEVAQLAIDCEHTSIDYRRGLIQWRVENHSSKRPEVVRAYRNSDERTLSGRGRGLHACERVGNLGLR